MRTSLLLLVTLALSCNRKDDPETGVEDRDGDGIPADQDCDDEDATVGTGTPMYSDSDGDGYGNPADPVPSCDERQGYVANGDDCDDTDAEVFPGNTDSCNGQDDDCDGEIDEDGTESTWYPDADGDGFGDEINGIVTCDPPSGYVDASGDCDDTDAAYYPGAPESCDDPNDYNCDGSVGYADLDGDGFAACEECDDSNADVRPDAIEVCNGIDDDCDGAIDDGASDADTYYDDVDGDGYGDDATAVTACEQPPGTVLVGGDCDDGAATINPAGTERCNTLDDDCDGDIDEDAIDARTWYRDGDSDGYGRDSTFLVDCEQPSGYASYSGDCNDADSAYHPGAPETDCTDPNDYNCDGSVGYSDVDGDGYVACEECDDLRSTVYPGATEYCNDLDDDCDTYIDEEAVDALTWYPDADADGYGDGSAGEATCDPDGGATTDSTDCDDGNALVRPGATEVCNDVDDDCDGVVDDGATDAITWYRDSDGDGYGDAATSTTGCDAPTGYVSNSTDCDDADATAFPGATEICDGVDDDCNGVIDDGATDAARWYADTDGDGYGNAGSWTESCTAPSGSVSDNTDCDDAVSSTHPGATEVCDGVDQDCDGAIDDSATDGDLYATDADGDGFGEPGTMAWACDGADNEWDCDDADPSEPIVVDGATGSATGSGTSSSPLDTIQGGIDVASECVVVYGGTYDEAIDFGGKDISVTGVEGADVTTIDAGGAGPAATFVSGETSAAVLSGFTLTNGSGRLESSSTSYSCSSVTICTDYYDNWCGGGVVAESSDPTLQDLIVVGNALPAASVTAIGDETWYVNSYGGGLCLLDSNATLSGVDVLENTADQGGGLYLDDYSSIAIEQSWVVENAGVDGGAFHVDGGAILLTNVAVTWNTATDGGGGLVTDGSYSATNATVGRNSGSSGGNLYLAGVSSGTVRNTIIWGSSSGEGVLASGSASWTGAYNNVQGNAAANYSGITDPTGTSGNISSNPEFVSVTSDGDPYNDDWNLLATSPSLNTGDPAILDADGSRSDMGAFGGPGGDWD